MDLWMAAIPENLDQDAAERQAIARRHRLGQQWTAAGRRGARASLATGLLCLALWLDLQAGETIQRPARKSPALKQVG